MLDYFRNKKNLTSLLVLSILVLGIPLGVNLVRTQQIIKSRAAVDPITFTGQNVRQKSNGAWVATESQIQFQLTSPLGPPAPSGTPRPSGTPTPSPSPRVSPSPTPTACSTKAPTGLSVTGLLSNAATLKWTPGSGGSSQRLRVSTTKEGVTSGCVTTACIIKVDNLTSAINSYNTQNVLAPGTTYWWRVINWSSANCWKDAVASFTTPQSLVSLKVSPTSGAVGTKVTFTATLQTTKTVKKTQGYQWWNRHANDGGFTDGPTYDHTYTTVGTYANPAVRVYFTDGTTAQAYGSTITISGSKIF